jgi:metallo-beta-lactamase family protein
MKINFVGAARTVTGSQHLININGHTLLIDCGLFQGGAEDSYKINSELPFDPSKVDAAILTHSHIDHCGNLPTLLKMGFEGQIYTTHASAHLARLMLSDSAFIQEADAEDSARSRNGRRKNGGKKNGGKKVFPPLYNREEADQVSERMVGTGYNKEFEIVPGVIARLVEAGHILGSASVILECEEKGKQTRIWLSGDIGRPRLPLVRDPILPFNADYLIMESTYGDTIHPEPEVAQQKLMEVTSNALERGGKVIIPAFALGRTQELVYTFNIMMSEDQIPKVPIIVDSPLAVNASDIFRDHPDFFDKETLEFINSGNAALNFDELTYVRSVEESKALHERDEPMVIISASGMAESGRILHHLAYNIEDPRNTVLLVSYQAPNTLGRKLEDGETNLEIMGQVFNRKAHVEKIRGFSAHAGQNDLIEYALAAKNTLKGVYLVHGEDKTAETLRDELQAVGLEKVLAPYPKQVIELD